jgi:hypothetical protein
MSNLTDLKGRMERLRLMLEDPHPGLYTWRLEYERAVEQLLAFFEADPQAAVRARQEAWDEAMQQIKGENNVSAEARPVGVGG